MKNKLSIPVLGFGIYFMLLLVSAFRPQPKGGQNELMRFKIPANWPQPVYDLEKHPVSRQGFELGRKLFFDPVLSADSSISCAGCHLPFTAFTHVDHNVSHGIQGLKGTRNTLSIINIAWNTSFMWDGSVNHIEVQPLAPIESKVEMHSSLKSIIEKLKRSDWYREKFRLVFGEKAVISGQLFLKALSQYMLALQSYNSKYDKVMRGEAGVLFTEAEDKGLQLFRKNCASCHTEPLFTNHGFENNGLQPDTFFRDGGRIRVTRELKDSLRFRTPTLRNIELSYPYMHDGRFKSLQMVLFHYNDGIHHTVNLSEKLGQPMNLSEQDKKSIIAFLKTLTDLEFLRNPDFTYRPGTGDKLE